MTVKYIIIVQATQQSCLHVIYFIKNEDLAPKKQLASQKALNQLYCTIFWLKKKHKSHKDCLKYTIIQMASFDQYFLVKVIKPENYCFYAKKYTYFLDTMLENERKIPWDEKFVTLTDRVAQNLYFDIRTISVMVAEQL